MSKIEQEAETKGVTACELLIQLFNTYGSQKAVADQLGVSQSTISTWLLKCSLEKKTVLVERTSPILSQATK